jgi:hypothetical protein
MATIIANSSRTAEELAIEAAATEAAKLDRWRSQLHEVCVERQRYRFGLVGHDGEMAEDAVSAFSLENGSD